MDKCLKMDLTETNNHHKEEIKHKVVTKHKVETNLKVETSLKDKANKVLLPQLTKTAKEFL